MSAKKDNWSRAWLSDYLPLHHRSTMTTDIIRHRNYTIFMLSLYLVSCCVVEALPLYFIRKTPTIIIINVIFGIETIIGILGFVFSNIYLILGFLSSYSATIFVFLLYFMFAAFIKGDWILLMVHGIPMIFDVFTLGSAARVTLGYWKWRQALQTKETAKVTASESHSTSSSGLEAAIAETKACESKVSCCDSSLSTADSSEQSDLEMGAVVVKINNGSA